MYKLPLILFSCFFLTLKLSASDSIVATLLDISSNSMQKFSLSQSEFLCHPYAVLPLESLAQSSKIDSECQNRIKKFYLKHPNLKEFAEQNLYVMQRYKIEFKGKQCLLYANAQESYSELLLRNGLAVLKPIFADREFEYTFKKAQKNAKLLQKGIWADNDINSCVESLYK